MLKNIFSGVLFLFMIFNISFVSAETNNTSTTTGFKELVIDNGLEFKAKYDDGVVYTSWKAFNKDEKHNVSDKFKWYKIVRSTTKSSPVYPDDGHIKYYDDVNKLEFTDWTPKSGTSYYRVCAITHEEIRYCSNVVKLNIDLKDEIKGCPEYEEPVCGYKDGKYKTYSNKCHLTNDKAYYKYSGKCKEVNNTGTVKDYGVSNTLKVKSKGIINRFIIKLDKKGYSNEKNIELIDKIIERLNGLEEEKPQLSNLLNYLIELLKDKKAKYQDDFSDIEDIFDID